MNPKIYFVNGTGGSGKDTFVDFVNKYVPTRKLSTIEATAGHALSMGWDGRKDEKGRQFLSAIKDARTAYNDGPAREIYTLVEHYQRHQKLSAIFIMVREFKEMIKMQKVLGGQTLLVVNNTILPGPTELAFLAQVPAEYQYDIVVKNNGTIGNLEREASLFAKHEVLTG